MSEQSRTVLLHAQECVAAGKERKGLMKSTKEFWSKRQFTDSSSMEQWLRQRAAPGGRRNIVSEWTKNYDERLEKAGSVVITFSHRLCQGDFYECSGTSPWVTPFPQCSHMWQFIFCIHKESPIVPPSREASFLSTLKILDFFVTTLAQLLLSCDDRDRCWSRRGAR